MEKFKAFLIKNRPYLLIALTVVILVVGIALERAANDAKNLVPVATLEPKPEVATGRWGTLSSLTKDLGDPITGKVDGEKQGTYEYKSNSVNLNHEVKYVRDVPVFYKEIINPDENKTSTGIKKEYGDAEIVLYGDFSDIGFNLYAYPSQGIAYIGSKEKDALLEVWYFAPTDITTFRKKWAPTYTLVPEEGHF